MKRLLLVLIAALALAVTAPAYAITDGALDGEGHPYVGLMVAKDADGNPLWRCSGTLLSETLYLTAGHCTEAPAAEVEIWFDSGPIALGSGYPNRDPAAANVCDGVTGYPCTGDATGTPETHPDYDPNAFYVRDLGVVVLDDPLSMSTYGELPDYDQLDSLKPSRKTIFTAVGYGLQKSFPDAASWKDQAIRQRMYSQPHLIQINGGIVGDFSLLLSNNANTGGTCFGDSGGPNFVGTSNVVGAVTSFGLNSTCGGTGGVFRVDRAWALDWIYDEFGAHLN